MLRSKPSTTELIWLTRKRLPLVKAAERYGVHPKTLEAWCHREGLKWPHSRYHRIEYGDRRVSLAEGARLAGIPPTVVYNRYDRGVRGDALWAPVSRGHSRQPPESYELELDGGDWNTVLEVYRELVEEYGDRAKAKRTTARKFGIPTGAIGAAERKEWYRLG